MVDAMGDAKLVAELVEPEQAADPAAGCVGLVLALCRRVETLGKPAAGVVPGDAAAEATDQDDADHAHADDRPDDLERRQSVEQIDEPGHVGRIGCRRRPDGQTFDDVVDQDLDRPRQKQHDAQSEQGESEFDRDLASIGPHELERPAKQGEGLPAGNAHPLRRRLCHSSPAMAVTRVAWVSAFTNCAYAPSSAISSSWPPIARMRPSRR